MCHRSTPFAGSDGSHQLFCEFQATFEISVFLHTAGGINDKHQIQSAIWVQINGSTSDFHSSALCLIAPGGVVTIARVFQQRINQIFSKVISSGVDIFKAIFKLICKRIFFFMGDEDSLLDLFSN